MHLILDLQVAVTVTKNNTSCSKLITGVQPCSSTPEFQQKFVLDAVLNCWVRLSLREKLTSSKKGTSRLVHGPRGLLIGEVVIDVNEVDEENYVVSWFSLML